MYIDRSTLFSTFISTADLLRPDQVWPYALMPVATLINVSCPQVAVYPREVMRWMGGLYARAFGRPDNLAAGDDSPAIDVGDGSDGGFGMRDHDYVWGARKCGGNAQRMSSAR